MNAYRTIINSDKLDTVMPIPQELKHQDVEVVVLPVNNSSQNLKADKLIQSLRGSFKGRSRLTTERFTSLKKEEKELDR